MSASASHHRSAFDRCSLRAAGWVLPVALVLLAGCAAQRGTTGGPSSTPAAAKAPAERVGAPGEAALAQGVKLYQAAQYPEAETQFKLSLQQGLQGAADRASAHKHLAFIYCTSKREALCASAFKAARQADPTFALSKAEAGHPMWGPVYRKALPPAR